MKKKLSLPIVIAIALISAAIAFSAAYLISTGSMNSKLKDLSQKQALFSTLSDVDGYVREKFSGEIDEQKLTHDICEAYSKSVGGGVIFVEADEAESSEYTAENGYTVMKLSDGSLIVVLTQEQSSELASSVSETAEMSTSE